MSEPVLVERHGHIAVLTLNRPEARNAVNLAVTLALGQALEEAEQDPDVWAVVLTGAGDQAFCAGADLKAVGRGERLVPDDPAQAAWGFAGYVRHRISKPTIAAVNGFALGGGTELVLASDLAVAAESAVFGLPEVSRGIMAAAGGAFRLVQQLPAKIAMELLLTGQQLSSDRALALGLINRVVPDSDLLPAAIGLASQICSNAPLAVQASKRVALGIRSGAIASEADAWRLTHDENTVLMRSGDAREGVRAFAEKRPPVWSGT